MKKLFSISLLIVITKFSYSQVNSNQQEESQRFLASQSQTTKTMKIDFSSYSRNVIGELKDELSMWKEKITLIEIDENLHQMKIAHNGLLDKRELYDLLIKYNIKESKIISYQ